MAWRDVDRGDFFFAPEDRPDRLLAVDQWGALPSRRTRIAVKSGQEGFTAADGGEIDDESEVGGNPDPAGMGDPLSVVNETVGAELKLLPRLQDDRNFPEGEKAWNIRKVDLHRFDGGLQDRQRFLILIFQVADDDGGEKPVRFKIGGDIDPRDRGDPVGRAVEDQMRPEGVLNFNRLPRAHPPGMKIPILHRNPLSGFL